MKFYIPLRWYYPDFSNFLVKKITLYFLFFWKDNSIGIKEFPLTKELTFQFSRKAFNSIPSTVHNETLQLSHSIRGCHFRRSLAFSKINEILSSRVNWHSSRPSSPRTTFSYFMRFRKKTFCIKVARLEGGPVNEKFTRRLRFRIAFAVSRIMCQTKTARRLEDVPINS